MKLEPRLTATVTFPEHLEAARELAEPALNPMPQQETIRWVNGLPKSPRSEVWLEAPAASLRRDLLRRFVQRELQSPAAQRLIVLLAERLQLMPR